MTQSNERQNTELTARAEINSDIVNYDEAIDGDISDDPNNPLSLILAEGTNSISATTGGGEQEYVTVTIPEGFQLDSLVLDSFTPNDVGFIGV